MSAHAGMTLAGTGPRSGPGLVLDRVTKVYPSRPPVTALAGVSLAVAAGELVAVLGPSGCGKTTLLHLAGTLDKPTSGTVRVTGLDVAGLSDRQLAGLRAESVGFVFQQFFLAELNSRGVTIVVVNHDHAIAARMRRQVEMLDGRIVSDTAPPAPPRAAAK